LVAIYIFQNYPITTDHTTEVHDLSKVHISTEPIIYILAIEHIVSYLFRIFRAWDIRNNGHPDRNGIMRAPAESILIGIE